MRMLEVIIKDLEQHGFINDSTVSLQLIKVKFAPKSNVQVISTPFKLQENIVQQEGVSEIILTHAENSEITFG